MHVLNPPVIGLTPNFFDADRTGAPHPQGSYYLNHPYVEAILAAGGIPVSLPYLEPGPGLERLLDRLDGVVATGGFDMDLRLFGEELHPTVERVHPQRLRFELDLIERVLERDMPLLGICLGMQTLNVLRGGSIHQHVPEVFGETIAHHQGEATRAQTSHPVQVVEGSLLHRLTKTQSLPVNSLHHQAVDRLGEGLAVSATSEDGLIEALEVPGKSFALGVQWHPEDLVHQPAQLALFQGLVEATRGDKQEDWKPRSFAGPSFFKRTA